MARLQVRILRVYRSLPTQPTSLAGRLQQMQSLAGRKKKKKNQHAFCWLNHCLQNMLLTTYAYKKQTPISVWVKDTQHFIITDSKRSNILGLYHSIRTGAEASTEHASPASRDVRQSSNGFCLETEDI